MNQTQKVFPLLEDYQNKIKIAGQDKEKKQTEQQAYSQYIIQCIIKATQEGYTLLVDDIVKKLDLEEAYIRRKILDELDYIVLPSGGAEAFTCTNMPHLNFMELRIRRWKKVYILKSSFDHFLERHLFIQAPFQPIRYDYELGRYVAVKNHQGKEEILYSDLPYHISYDYHFIRKANYITYVSRQKTAAFYRKTKSDIIYAYKQQLIDAERLKKEMALLTASKNSEPLLIEAYPNEAEKYAELEGRVKFKLCLEKESNHKKNDIILYNQIGVEDWKLKDVF